MVGCGTNLSGNARCAESRRLEGATRCLDSQYDYSKFYWWTANPISGAPYESCRTSSEPIAGGKLPLDSIDFTGQAISDELNGSTRLGGSQLGRTIQYNTGIRGHYLPPLGPATSGAPTAGTDASWTGTRLPSDLPARPERGGETADLIGQALGEHEALRREVIDVLNQQEPEDEAEWAVTQVDGGPATGVNTVPRCADATGTTCTARLRAAGFTGTITTARLTAAEAVMEHAADTVTGTRPAARSHANLATAITIYANPLNMPELTTDDLGLAETLETTNPESIDEDNKLTVAYRCRQLASATGSGRMADDCATLPLFITGGADAQGPGWNDLDALISRNPSWVALHHRASTATTGWYNSPSIPGCQSGVDEPDAPAGTSLDCHEFPFWSTMQAYGGSLNTMVPSIHWTIRTENRRQGAKLNKFYSAGSAGKWAAGCDVPPAPDTGSPLSASAFLNVPIPMADQLETTWACNKPALP